MSSFKSNLTSVLSALSVLFFVLNSCVTLKLNQIDPDELRNTSELIRSKGYYVEDHEVHTKDGYILDIQRIPSLKEGPKSVVFLQHGLSDSSATWVLNFPNQSLAFVLADEGYDVWLGNMRGNSYGIKHESLSPESDAFWDFSFDEMSNYDLVSMVDHALNVTNQTKLIYVGHSQGTMISFAQLSKNKEFASKIKLFVALGPVAHLGHVENSLKDLAEILKPTKGLIAYDVIGKREFLNGKEFRNFFAAVCRDHILSLETCSKIYISKQGGGPSVSFNASRIPIYLSHSPDGTSVKNMVHFAQLVYSNKFQMYDFGSSKENIIHYNESTPPIYELNKVTVPVALYSGRNDYLADPLDVQFLRNTLPNIADDYIVEIYNHQDFVWAVNTKEQIYNRMITLMKKYENKF